MKKAITIFITITTLLVGIPSAKADNPEPVIDVINKTIEYNNILYNYELNNNQLIITPTSTDACTYYEETKQDGTSSGVIGECSNYDYDTMNKLISTIKTKDTNIQNDLDNNTNKLEEDNESTKNDNPGLIVFLIIIFLIIGLFYTFSPNSAWKITHGWHYKNAEPSEKSLIFFRVSGIISLIIALILIILLVVF